MKNTWCVIRPAYYKRHYNRPPRPIPGPSNFFFFFFITLGLEMSDTHVYEP